MNVVDYETSYSVSDKNVLVERTTSSALSTPHIQEFPLDAVQGAKLLTAVTSFATTPQPSQQFTPAARDTPYITISALSGGAGSSVETDGVNPHPTAGAVLEALESIVSAGTKTVQVRAS
jgi:hypothetical protein